MEDRDRVHDVERLDKWQTGAEGWFKPYREAIRQERIEKRRRRKYGPSEAEREAELRRYEAAEQKRRRCGADYLVAVAGGRVAEHGWRGFGISYGTHALFLHAHRAERPPVGTTGFFAFAGDNQHILVGTPDDENRFILAERSWRRLLGHPIRRTCVMVVLLVAWGFWALVLGQAMYPEFAFNEKDIQLFALSGSVLAFFSLRRWWHTRRNYRGYQKQLQTLSGKLRQQR